MKNGSHIAEQVQDIELLHRLLRDDREAFALVYERYRSMLYSVAIRYLQDDELAKDAVQSVFLSLWNARTQLDPTGSLRNYLFTMTKNHVLNIMRHHAYMVEQMLILSQESTELDDSVTEIEDLKLQHEMLCDAINKLPPQKKIICKMKLDGRHSNQDIADQLGLSVNTVKAHYQRALALLRIMLRGEGQ